MHSFDLSSLISWIHTLIVVLENIVALCSTMYLTRSPGRGQSLLLKSHRKHCVDMRRENILCLHSRHPNAHIYYSFTSGLWWRTSTNLCFENMCLLRHFLAHIRFWSALSPVASHQHHKETRRKRRVMRDLMDRFWMKASYLQPGMHVKTNTAKK